MWRVSRTAVPTREHQRILALVLKRMRVLGFSVLSIDGQTEALDSATSLRPQTYGRHRPDAIGRSGDGSLCIGEAKTADDFGSSHTREQLEDYLSIQGAEYPLVLLGYPRSAGPAVTRLLDAIGAVDCPQLELIPVPDELLHD